MKKNFLNLISLLICTSFLFSSNIILSMTTADELVYANDLLKKYTKNLPLSNEEIDYIKVLYGRKRLFTDNDIYISSTMLINLLEKHIEDLLNNLHKEYKNNPSRCKTYDIKAIETTINLLEARIKKIENELLPENILESRKILITIGCIPIIIVIAFGIPIAYEIYKKHKEFISGKFNHINISSALFKKLSSTRFTLAEKRYLNKFNVKKITVNDRYDEDWYPSYAKESEFSTQNLSFHNKKKLTDLALNHAIKKHQESIKEDIKSKMLNLLLSGKSLLALYSSCLIFLIAFFEPGMKADLLEKDRKFLEALTKELESRFSFNAKLI